MVQRNFRGDDEDELFNQALSTSVDQRTLDLFQKAVANSTAILPSSSNSRRIQSSAVYTPPEFEPVKKKARNFDHEDNFLRKYLLTYLCT